jgi:hypothetical protein
VDNTRKTDKVRLASVEMRSKRTAGHTLSDHNGKDEIMTELQILKITEFLKKDRRYLKKYFDTINSDGVPKKILKCQPVGKETAENL